jgi:hypothetical protein
VINLIGETALTDRTFFHGMARNPQPLHHHGKARPLIDFFTCNREFFKAIGLEKQRSAGFIEKYGDCEIDHLVFE